MQGKTSIGKVGVGKDGRASTIHVARCIPAICEFLGKGFLSRERSSFVTSVAALNRGSDRGHCTCRLSRIDVSSLLPSPAGPVNNNLAFLRRGQS